ncbi:MAG TPA: phosphatase PAP2 family protein [Bacillota bacterium]|nr:phosphatase PAP2 family protein [Bacillota bacterium]
MVNSWGMVSSQIPLLNEIFVFLGHYFWSILIGIALIAIFILYIQKRKKESLILLSALILGYVLEQVIKFVIQRPRPTQQLIQEVGYSFPSGHSIFAIILFSLLIYFYKDRIKNSLLKIIFISINVFLILLVGLSRIYINVHWFSDVIGGYAIGFFVVYLISWIFESGKQKIFKNMILKTKTL